MRVLFLTHRLPYAPNRGDRLRAYHMLQYLRTRTELELISLIHDDEEAAHIEDVRAFIPRVTGLRVQPWRTRANAAGAMLTNQPLTHALLDAPGVGATIHDIVERRCPDVVFAYCSGMARFALQPPLDRVPLVLDFVDVDSQKWRDLATESRWPRSWIYRREATTLGAFEAMAATRAAAALVVNAREAALARALAPSATVHVLSNGVEVERLRPIAPPNGAPRVVFCGVMDYAPNDEGMQWFVREVWPLVRKQRPDATLSIVGRGATPVLRGLCGHDASITVTGRVKDVRDSLWESAVGIAPLHVARGVQNKALEAIAAGLPIVITDAVAGGLPPEAMAAARVANTPPAFAQQVVDLLSLSAEERRAIAASVDLRQLTWARTLAPLMSILERAAGASHPREESAVARIAWRSA